LIIAAIGVLVYALYRYRVQQIIRLQKVRNRIATDLHDEIGSNLTNISILSNLSERNILQPQKATDFLQRISQEVASSSQALDDIIWSVNTNHDTLEETVARMRRYAAELFDAANISYDLGLDPAFEERKLVMEQRRDVYLLYKEAVNNISKHACARQVSIQIAIEHSQLLLNIKDDGKGFDTTKEFNRHGLQGMKERVKRWKGKIIIQSAIDKGTSIEIRLPVAK
jgi:signal transduction histidine kinase